MGSYTVWARRIYTRLAEVAVGWVGGGGDFTHGAVLFDHAPLRSSVNILRYNQTRMRLYTEVARLAVDDGGGGAAKCKGSGVLGSC